MSQHEKERRLLERIRAHFGCGTLYHKGPNSSVMTYSVTKLVDLEERIIPFFEDHRLITAKRNDFQLFRQVLDMMEAGSHLQYEGMAAIASITERMNRKQRSRFLESSEAIRQPSPSDVRR